MNQFGHELRPRSVVAREKLHQNKVKMMKDDPDGLLSYTGMFLILFVIVEICRWLIRSIGFSVDLPQLSRQNALLILWADPLQLLML